MTFTPEIQYMSPQAVAKNASAAKKEAKSDHATVLWSLRSIRATNLQSLQSPTSTGDLYSFLNCTAASQSLLLLL